MMTKLQMEILTYINLTVTAVLLLFVTLYCVDKNGSWAILLWFPIGILIYYFLSVTKFLAEND